MTKSFCVADYLFYRLAQLGVKSVHGVPGDYTLTILDASNRNGLTWVGNANELNAGYAADGYARIKGLSALVTSYGVGELSAINAIAGAYAERAPVVHIVGTPKVDAQRDGLCLHHSLGDGNLRVFADMYKSVTIAQANLCDASTASQLIDATLKQCILHSQPVYIEIPTDVVDVQVAVPDEPIDMTLQGFSQIIEDQAVDRLIGAMQNAKRPLILVDGLTATYDVRDEVNALVQTTGFATLVTSFGKGLVDEAAENFHGIYAGFAGDPAHVAWVKGCDLILSFGPLRTDITTYGFTAQLNDEATITLMKNTIHFGDHHGSPITAPGIYLQAVLSKTLHKLKSIRLPAFEPFPENPDHPRELVKILKGPDERAIVDQCSFWLRMSDFLRPHDIILADAGTALYGTQSMVLPENTRMISSPIWVSIGYVLAASQGISLAQRDIARGGGQQPGRTVVFEGDGAFQMTAQAISDIIRNRLDVTIFVLNNNGYTVERLIHGPCESYNDIQMWQYLESPRYFGAPENDPEYPVRVRRAENWGQLMTVLGDEGIQGGKGLNMIEVMMEVDDSPITLRKFGKYLRERNSGKIA